MTQVLDTLRRQAATTEHGRVIREAGLGDALDKLLRTCAANVAQGLAVEEDQ